ncbi:hypothetical protein TNCV_5085841 [Trichonephila clavipes]|uniref:Uncharacterized protein n=1 Tax=Trichonephila clavipes TaxID=2585209 RepID=A0A8X6VCC6_TRICX|nr:hypothetical protein TNCV_5085841 [Trichonephila clavipes]
MSDCLASSHWVERRSWWSEGKWREREPLSESAGYFKKTLLGGGSPLFPLSFLSLLDLFPILPLQTAALSPLNGKKAKMINF